MGGPILPLCARFRFGFVLSVDNRIGFRRSGCDRSRIFNRGFPFQHCEQSLNDGRNQEIAVNLNLSERTVRNYLLRIFDKFGISSRVELALYAFSGVEGMAPSVGTRAVRTD
jgi:Bacterial regulatory proteins, luxR family